MPVPKQGVGGQRPHCSTGMQLSSPGREGEIPLLVGGQRLSEQVYTCCCSLLHAAACPRQRRCHVLSFCPYQSPQLIQGAKPRQGHVHVQSSAPRPGRNGRQHNLVGTNR